MRYDWITGSEPGTTVTGVLELAPGPIRTTNSPVTVVPGSDFLQHAMQYPHTPDGRYFVVRGRLWRCSNPALSEEERDRLTRELMRHRSAVGRANKSGNREAMREARRGVHEAKVALGERGPVWWDDGSPDYNRHMARNTPYKEWFEALEDDTNG